MFSPQKAYNDYVNFIKNLNDNIRGTKLTDSFEISPVYFMHAIFFLFYSNLILLFLQKVQRILDILEKLNGWIDEVPPIQQPQRFGNKAFKIWLTKVKEVDLFLSNIVNMIMIFE